MLALMPHQRKSFFSRYAPIPSLPSHGHVARISCFGRDCCANDVFDAVLLKSAASKMSYLGQSLPNRKSRRVASSHCNATHSGPERHFSSTTTSPQTVHNTDIFSSGLMATLLTSPGALDPSEHCCIDGSSTRGLVIPVHPSALPSLPKTKNVQSDFFWGPMTLTLSCSGVLEDSEHARINDLSTRSPVEPVHLPLPPLPPQNTDSLT